LDLKGQWGLSDPRLEMKNCDICANDVFRNSWKDTGVRPEAFQPPSFCKRPEGTSPPPGGDAAPPAGALPANADLEALIQTITDRVMAALDA
jgi:L-fuculose-phosphate aldolase